MYIYYTSTRQLEKVKIERKKTEDWYVNVYLTSSKIVKNNELFTIH